MKISLELQFDQLLQFIRQLSLKDKKLLLDMVQKEVSREEKPNDLQKLLLAGPTWSEEEYQNFLTARQQLEKVGIDVIS